MRTVDPGMEVMLETFIHETESMLEQLDEILLESEREKNLSDDHISNIFRITHTIKGSAAMMSFDSISNLSHAIEDVFFLLRDDPQKLSLVFDTLFDLMLSSSDALKSDLERIQADEEYEEIPQTELIDKLHKLAGDLANGEVSTDIPAATEVVEAPINELEGVDPSLTQIRVYFEENCQMENMRAFMLLTQLQHVCSKIESIPANPEADGTLCEEIIKNGFLILCKPLNDLDEVTEAVGNALSVKSYEVEEPDVSEPAPAPAATTAAAPTAAAPAAKPAAAPATKPAAAPAKPMGGTKQSLISVNQSKLDQLMDLVGELVTAESMVIRNPDLEGLKLDSFSKSIRELRKLTDELQDIVMSIRMVPLSGTFLKMERIVRDMSKKLNKKARLVTEGGTTEIDKTINDAIVDPFMHMIRNSMDHAIETVEERLAAGKPEEGTIKLSAKNVGGEIHINITDDGCGLNAQKLLAKAAANGILTKPENEYTDKEAFGLIMLAGFSTNTEVTEFSGRGVGMDVVRKNIESVGGSISINSVLGEGTTFTIKIPLTLAIVDGMNIRVGETIFTLPITSITQSFKATSPDQIVRVNDTSELIMIRGECYPVLRLYETYGIDTHVEDVMEGILIQIESATSSCCIFADELLGEYQVVVKPFPSFFGKYNLKDGGLSGCSILGDGSISLILDVNGLIK